MTAGVKRGDLLDLPPTIDVVTAGKALGVGRSKAFQMAAADAFPVPVHRLGHRYRVVTSDLWRFLGIHPESNEAAPLQRNDLTSSRPDKATQTGPA